MKSFFILILITIGLFLTQCKKYSIGGFDIKYGSGSEMWEETPSGDVKISRGNAYRDYYHDKWR